MRLVAFDQGERARVGVLDDDGGLVHDVTGILPPGASVLNVIEDWSSLGPTLAAQATTVPGVPSWITGANWAS